MPLTPGVIDADELNDNFADTLSDFNAFYADKHLYRCVAVRCLNLSNATAASSRTVLFTPSANAFLNVIGLKVWNNNATSKTVTVTLTAVTANGTELPSYLLGQTVSTSVTIAAATTLNASRLTYDSGPLPLIVLMQGITYSLKLSSDNADAVTTAYGFITLKDRRSRI